MQMWLFLFPYLIREDYSYALIWSAKSQASSQICTYISQISNLLVSKQKIMFWRQPLSRLTTNSHAAADHNSLFEQNFSSKRSIFATHGETAFEGILLWVTPNQKKPGNPLTYKPITTIQLRQMGSCAWLVVHQQSLDYLFEEGAAVIRLQRD